MVHISWSWEGLYEHLTNAEKTEFLGILRELRACNFVAEIAKAAKSNDSEYYFDGSYEQLKADPELVKKIVALYRRLFKLQWAARERFEPILPRIAKHGHLNTQYNVSVAHIEGMNQVQLELAAKAVTDELALPVYPIKGRFPYSGKNHWWMSFVPQGMFAFHVLHSDIRVNDSTPLIDMKKKIEDIIEPYDIKMDLMKVDIDDGRLVIVLMLSA